MADDDTPTFIIFDDAADLTEEHFTQIAAIHGERIGLLGVYLGQLPHHEGSLLEDNLAPGIHDTKTMSKDEIPEEQRNFVDPKRHYTHPTSPRQSERSRRTRKKR